VDPEIDKRNATLPFLDRGGVWFWRVRRRIFRQRHTLFWLTLGGGFGGALGLGMLRAVIAVLGDRMLVGAQFAINAFWGWILGAAVSLGFLLAEPLLLRRRSPLGERHPLWRTPIHPDRLPELVGVLSGAMVFWLGHVLVLTFSSLSPLDGIRDPLRTLTVVLAGLGLGMALHGQSRVVQAEGLRRQLLQPANILRTGFAGLMVLLGEWIFGRTRGINSLAIVWTRDLYNASFFDLARQRFPQLLDQFPGWPLLLAYLDAVLVGIILSLGINAGLSLSLTWLTRWQEVVNRGDG
jgi:hypothetical protein